jgi:hypothetical protein
MDDPRNNREGRNRKEMAAAGRTAIELLLGRLCTNDEWAMTQATLLEFASILRCWDRAASRGKVEVLCQPEP